MIDKILKYLGIAWSLIAFFAAGLFFLGGEWQQWKNIKEIHAKGHQYSDYDLTQYVKKDEIIEYGFIKDGENFSLNSDEGYLYSNNAANRDEVDVLIYTSPTYWTLKKQ